MNTATEVAVTLTDELLSRLRDEALRLGVPLEWVVASLVVDTFDADRTMPALG